ncbi:MAG: ABC transporter permease [Candidatus Acidiferrales bacterium]
MRYLTRRLLHGVFLLLGVSFISFALMQLAPGDFFSEMQLQPEVRAETVAALRSQYGLNRSLPARYAEWLAGVAHGDMGKSFAYNAPVAPLLLVRVRNTLLLTVTATLVSWFLALALGIWAATHEGKWTDHLLSLCSSGMLVVPDILLALALLLFAARTGLLPTGGMVSLDFADLSPIKKFQDLAVHLLIPTIALVIIMLPVLFRHVRAAIVEVLHAPYFRAAKAHGISRRRLLFRHALPAAANPLLTLFGFSLASLLSASMLVEVILSWPGLGPLLLEAAFSRDLNVVVGGIMFSSVLLVAGNLVADALLCWSDPRIRTE